MAYSLIRTVRLHYGALVDLLEQVSEEGGERGLRAQRMRRTLVEHEHHAVKWLLDEDETPLFIEETFKGSKVCEEGRIAPKRLGPAALTTSTGSRTRVWKGDLG